MLTTPELDEIKRYVLRELPRVLEQDPQFVVFIEGIISEKFPRRDEFARLLDELTATRQEMRQDFQKVDVRFEQVDWRFEQVDQRFDQVDQRFDQVDRRFEQVRQEMHDQGIELRQEMDGLGAQLRQEMREQGTQLRQEMHDQGVQLRQEMREQGTQLRQEMDGLGAQLRQEMREQGTQLRQEMHDQGTQLRQEMHDLGDRLSQDMRDLRDWVELIAGRLQTRVGRNLEDIVAGALRLGLSRPDIDPQNVRLRQKISDPTGLVYKPGKQKEVDLVAQDGELLVFEVKSAPDVDDVDEFADKVELVRLQNPDKRVTGVSVAVGAEADVRQYCAQRGVQLIP